MRQVHGKATRKKAAKTQKSHSSRDILGPEKKTSGPSQTKFRGSAKSEDPSVPKWSSRVDEPVGKFRQKRVNKLLRLMRVKCLFQYEAAPVAGVGVKTVQRWLIRGRKHQESIDAWNACVEELEENGETMAEVIAEVGHRPKSNQWSRFAVAYERAEVVAKGRIMHVARMGSLMDPKLAFEWLRRRYPNDFSDRPRPAHGSQYDDTATGSPIDELESELSGFFERAGATPDPSPDGPGKVSAASA